MQENIVIRGVRQNNLKGFDLTLPRNKLSSSSPAFPAAANPRWRSTRSTPRGSGATSNPFPPTRASFWGRWKSRT